MWGYDRLDTVEQTHLLNQLYDKMWLYYNFFQPVMRLKEKILLPSNGPKPRIKRKFDTARTPFDRLCASDDFSPDAVAQLRAMRETINPRLLRLEIYSLLDQLFTLPLAAPWQHPRCLSDFVSSYTSHQRRGRSGNIFK